MRIEGRTALAWRRGRYVPLPGLRGPRPAPLSFAPSCASGSDFLNGEGFARAIRTRARLHAFDHGYLMIGPGDDGVVLNAGGEMIVELCAYSQLGQRKPPLDLDTEPTGEVLQDIVVGFDAAYRNYYHWLVNALARSWLCAQVSPGKTVMLPDFHAAGDEAGQVRRAAMQASLEAALCDTPYRLLAPGLYRFRNLHALWTRPTAPTDIVDIPRLHELFDAMVARAGGWPARRRRRLYYSRRGAHDPRMPAHEALALDGVLARHGFEVLTLETMSFEAQMQAAAQAQIIMAPHGAGLTNMVFSHRDAMVVELASPVDGEPTLRPWFFQLASSRGQRYAAVKVGQAGWLQDLDAALSAWR